MRSESEKRRLRELEEEPGSPGPRSSRGSGGGPHFSAGLRTKRSSTTVETPEERVTLSDEHIAYQWLPYGEALQAITFGNSKRVVSEAHEHLTMLQSRESG